jgi:hypothetical protein
MLAFILIVMMMVSALFSEYLRVHSLQGKVETQLTQAANVSVEAAMKDEYRQDHQGEMNTDVARESFVSYLLYEMGLDASATMTDSAGRITYRLDSPQLSMSAVPPSVSFTCTLRIPSMFSFFTTDMLVPMDIQSRNRRLE